MTAFIIGVIIYFSLSLALSLISIGVNASKQNATASIGASAINVLISIGFITWSIILLVS